MSDVIQEVQANNLVLRNYLLELASYLDSPGVTSEPDIGSALNSVSSLYQVDTVANNSMKLQSTGNGLLMQQLHLTLGLSREYSILQLTAQDYYGLGINEFSNLADNISGEEALLLNNTKSIV